MFQTFHERAFQEWWQPAVLEELDQAFLAYLQAADPALKSALMDYRAQKSIITPPDLSHLLIACSEVLEAFLIQFFDIASEAHQLSAEILSFDPIFAFKKWFVLRQAKRRLRETLPNQISFTHLTQDILHQIHLHQLDTVDLELAFSRWGQQVLQSGNQAEEENLTQWCVMALSTPEGKNFVKEWVSFSLPERFEGDHLVKRVEEGSHSHTLLSLQSPREGFTLTDPRMTLKQVQDHTNYCIYCHEKEDDFCAKGFPVQKGGDPEDLRLNLLGETLTGCPLEEKISEMNFLRHSGYSLAALAIVMIDNPLCAATGHRICNDCMKSCIYQKQTPVDIPQIETRTLLDVLNLPWGVEIYDLLMRWNPLRKSQWVMKPNNGRRVMIMGMGPAGFTLAHHLLMEGCTVVGADGLKIEPLPPQYLDQPVHSYQALTQRLDQRTIYGFGGVAEYGITARWDKNFLSLIYLSLSRRKSFQVFGQVRFGGTFLVEDAWRLGFDHLALAVGAGLPRELRIPGSLAPGMRQANDFLMSLQLTGATQLTGLTNFEVSLPALVIGGGLTGVDAATELQAYYLLQIEKILFRYEHLESVLGTERLRGGFTVEDQLKLDRWLAHGKAARLYRQHAEKKGEKANFIPLLQEWGGVTIVYRRSMQESPAYRFNYRELQQALNEGVMYVEKAHIQSVSLNERGEVNGLLTDQGIIPAHTILVATGAQPNVAYEYEHNGTFHKHQQQYVSYDEEGEATDIPTHCKSKSFGAFTSYFNQDRRVSFLGDTHPLFHGSVVKAIASAKRIYPHIMSHLENISVATLESQAHFQEKIADQFSAILLDKIQHAPDVLELIIRAPQAATHYQAGQLYRLQNYETFAKKIGETLLRMEGLSLQARVLNKEKGMLSFFILHNTVSSRLANWIEIGEPIALMGPTGVRIKIPEIPSTILVIGSRVSIPFILAYGPACQAAHHKIIYLAQIPTEHRFCEEEVKHACNRVLWIEETETWETILLQNLKPAEIDLVHIVGDHQLSCEFQKLRHHHDFKENLVATASAHGPMQCMLKGVCAQCLQWQVDPHTGERIKAVYACSWQQQPLEKVDFHHLAEREAQNRCQEKLTHLWLDEILPKPLPILGE